MPDTEEPSDSVLTPRFDCANCTDYESEYGLDFADVESVTYRSEFCNAIGQEEYEVLSFDAECCLLSALGDVHDPENVCRVLDPHYRWKVSSNPKEHDYPQHHEHLFKQTFEVECEVRGDDPPSYQPDPNDCAVAGDLYCVTQAFLDRQNGPKLTVYRGLSRHAAKFIARTLRAETRPVYEMPANVLKNFTASESFGSFYSSLLFRLDVPRTAIAIAADHLAKHRQGGSPAERDAEYRIFGDEIGTVSPDDIYLYVDGSRTPLFDFLRAKSSFTRAEHRCYVDSIRQLAKKDERVTDDPGVSRIADWYETLVEDEYELAEAIEEVLHYVVGETNELPSDWEDDLEDQIGTSQI